MISRLGRSRIGVRGRHRDQESTERNLSPDVLRAYDVDVEKVTGAPTTRPTR